MVANTADAATKAEKGMLEELMEDVQVMAKELPNATSISNSVKGAQAVMRYNFDVFQSWMHRGDGITPDERDEVSVDDMMLDMKYVSKDSSQESYSASVEAKYMVNWGNSMSFATRSEASRHEIKKEKKAKRELDIEEVRDRMALQRARDAAKYGIENNETEADETDGESTYADDTTETSGFKSTGSSFASTLNSGGTATAADALEGTTTSIMPKQTPSDAEEEEKNYTASIREAIKEEPENLVIPAVEEEDKQDEDGTESYVEAVREQPSQESVMEIQPVPAPVPVHAHDDDRTITSTTSKLSLFGKGKTSFFAKRASKKASKAFKGKKGKQ